MQNWLEYLTDEDIYKFVCTHFDSKSYVHDFERFQNRINRTIDVATGKFKIIVFLDQGKFKKYNATFSMYEYECNIQDGLVNPWFSASRLYEYKTTSNKDLMEMVHADFIKLMISKCGGEYEKEYKQKILDELNNLITSHKCYAEEIAKKVNIRFIKQLNITQDEEKIKAIKETQARVVGAGVEKVNLSYEKRYKAIDERYEKIFGESIFKNVKKPQPKIAL